MLAFSWAIPLTHTFCKVGARDMNLKERPEMGHIMNGLRILTVLGVWVMSDFPSVSDIRSPFTLFLYKA